MTFHHLVEALLPNSHFTQTLGADATLVVFIKRKQATVNSQHSIYAKSAINPKHGV
jgi:hypothetical protein